MRPSAGRPYALIYPLFALSGFCGLIYESIWASYLKLFLGHAAYAQTVVLVVFIGGMAIGAALCGRYANRLRNPLLLYAAAEFVVGWCAIGFHHVFVFATDWAYATLLPATCSAEGLCLSSWILAALLIVPQSILLGTTFPLMAAGALRLFPSEPGRRIALLYFLNSLGAVFGVLASGFLLIPTIGLPGASLVAGILNVLLSIAIYVLVDPRRVRPPSVVRAAPAPAGSGPRLLLAVALLTGLSSFVYEVVWIRMLSLVLGASTQAFELMLASFILGLALGGAWIRRRIDRLRDAARFLAGVQIVMGVLAILTLPLYSHTFDAMAWLLRSLARTDSGFVLFNVGSSLIASAVMLPAAFAAGTTLPLVTLLLFRSGAGEASIGRVYAWNTLGSILGVVLAVHVGLPVLGLKGSLLAGAAIDVALGVALLMPAMRTAPRVAAGWIAAGLAAVVVAPYATSIDPMRTSSGVFRHGISRLGDASRVLYHEDGKSASISAFTVGDRTVIATNGKPDASIVLGDEGTPSPDEYTMTLAAVLPFAHRPDIARAAVIGFGSGLSTAALLGSPHVARVDSIEIEPAMVEGARVFRPRVAPAFDDPRSRIIVDDAKSYFARSRERYDLILSEPSNPWVSGTASLFTEEFYRRIRSALSPGGLFVQWVQIYEFDSRLLASITNAMNTAFADYVVYRTEGDLLFVARADGTVPRARADVFAFEGLKPELERLGVRTVADLDARRIVRKPMLRQLMFFQAAPVNSDYEPFVDAAAPRARFRRELVAEASDMLAGDVPVLEFFDVDWRSGAAVSPPVDRSGFLRPLEAYRSSSTLRYLEALLDGARPAPPAEGLARAATDAFDAVLLRCDATDRADAFWDLVVDVAAQVNTHHPRERLARFWSRVARSACASELDERHREWIGLFDAVGRRDPEAVARRSAALLQSTTGSPRETEFLLVAGMTGAMASGQFSGARAMYDRWKAADSRSERNAGAVRVLGVIGGFGAQSGALP